MRVLWTEKIFSQADAHVRRCNGANEFERQSRKKERLKKRGRKRQIEKERERVRARERGEGGRRDGEPKKSGRDGTGE